MAIVYYPGSWELLHLGHINAIEKASKLGSLHLGVESDDLFFESKKRKPIISSKDRLDILKKLFPNFYPEIYNNRNYHFHINGRYDIFACGPEFGKRKDQLLHLEQCAKFGIIIARIPRTEGISTTHIINRIKNVQL